MGIFWIASYPKSGNTWMRAFLANLFAPEPPVSINEFARFVPSEAAGNFHRQHGEPGIELHRPSEAGARSRLKVQAAIAESFGERHVILKTHNALATYKGVPLINAEVTIGGLYILRDPRDVAVSFAKHFGKSLDDSIAFMAKTDAYIGGTKEDANPGVFEFLGTWANHVTSWTRANPTVIRYEDMQADPLAAFTKTAAALGMGDKHEAIERAVEAADFQRLKAAEREEGYAEGSSHGEPFFREGRSGGWRAVLTEAQARRIRDIAGAVMERYDYR